MHLKSRWIRNKSFWLISFVPAKVGNVIFQRLANMLDSLPGRNARSFGVGQEMEGLEDSISVLILLMNSVSIGA